MEQTPPIPDWIRGYRHPAYTNVYELIPDEPRLYGTESLYGNWDAPLLLLAKDFAPRSLVEDRIAAGDPRPYRHEPRMRTNKNLVQLVSRLGSNLLYGSAAASLLRNDGRVSGTLPRWSEVRTFAEQSLRFTLENMPNVRGIACLGEVAWRCAGSTLGIAMPRWRHAMETRSPATANGLLLYAHAHPAFVYRHRGWTEAVEDWHHMAYALGVTHQAAA